MKHQPHKSNTKDGRRRSTKSFSKYYGMAFQIFGMLLVTMWIGKKLDTYFNNEINYLAAFLPVIVLVVYLYKVVHTLSKDNK